MDDDKLLTPKVDDGGARMCSKDSFGQPSGRFGWVGGWFTRLSGRFGRAGG